jgi:hypothetical protein
MEAERGELQRLSCLGIRLGLKHVIMRAIRGIERIPLHMRLPISGFPLLTAVCTECVDFKVCPGSDRS